MLDHIEQSRRRFIPAVEALNASLTALLADAGVRPEAAVVIFHTADQADGYTSLDLRFLTNQDVMLAMKLNDVTLPAHKGFPIQLVATAKFGYKWAKWITRIQVSDDTDFRGYWEARGYHQVADDDGQHRSHSAKGARRFIVD